MRLGQFYEEEAFVAFLFLPNQILVRNVSQGCFCLGILFFWFSSDAPLCVQLNSSSLFFGLLMYINIVHGCGHFMGRIFVTIVWTLNK